MSNYYVVDPLQCYMSINLNKTNNWGGKKTVTSVLSRHATQIN